MRAPASVAAPSIDAFCGVLRASELPSQIDDLDGDHKPDELAFQIDLKPHQTRIVTITWGAPDRIFRLRGDYEPQTNAITTYTYDGVGNQIAVTDANNHTTSYAYDSRTFRLARLRTERYIEAGGDTYHPTESSQPLQDLVYEYDLAGKDFVVTAELE